jgi:hypothetical protein
MDGDPKATSFEAVFRLATWRQRWDNDVVAPPGMAAESRGWVMVR